MAPHLSHRAPPRPQVSTLLVAEDNASMRARFVHELGQCAPDVAVTQVGTAAEAVAALAEHTPETLVLDVSLPDRDGVDLALALRRGGYAGRLVLLTTDRSGAALVEAARAGATVLVKPFTAWTLADALEQSPADPVDVAPRPGVLLPSVARVRSVLAELLQAEPEVHPGPPVLPKLHQPAAVALYVRDRLETGGVVVADARMSLWLSGSLGLLPTDALASLLATPHWPSWLDGDLREAADMLRGLFTLPSTPSLRLYSVHRPGARLDPLLARAAHAVRSRLDLVVSTPEHGDAGLSLVVPQT